MIRESEARNGVFVDQVWPLDVKRENGFRWRLYALIPAPERRPTELGHGKFKTSLGASTLNCASFAHAPETTA